MRAYSVAAWLAAVAILLPGCGTPIVEPGRSRPVLQGAGQPAQPPAKFSGTAAAPDDRDLERVPLSQVVKPRDVDRQAIYHEVRAGETLAAIAAKYHVTRDRLIRANGLEKTGTVQPGQLVFIPGNKNSE